MGSLAALFTLLCVYAPVCGAEGCSGFRHLDNGQTFFRYGGLLVIFRCRPGYKLHGYKTNSCVSGHWSRDTPICAGSGCSHPGPIPHGTSSMNEDGSWAVFSCDRGFWLFGPSRLYCKGHNWNSTKPVCRESDMMSSLLGVHSQKPNIQQNLRAAVAPKTQQQTLDDTLADTPSREADLRLGLLPPPQTSKSQRDKVTNPKILLEPQSKLPNFKVKDGYQTRYHESQVQETNQVQVPERGVHVSEGEALEEGKLDTQMFASKSADSITVSSSVSGTQLSVSPSPSSSRVHTPTITAATSTVLSAPTSQHLPTGSAPPGPRSNMMLMFEDHGITTDDVTPPVGSSDSTDDVTPPVGSSDSTDDVTPPVESSDSTDDVTPPVGSSDSLHAADRDQQIKPGLQFLSQAGSTENKEPTETSSFTLFSSAALVTTSSSSSSSPSSSSVSPSPKLPSFSTQISSSPCSTQTTKKTHPPNSSTAAQQRSHWTEDHNVKPSLLNLIRRPVCPYPPVPVHGTFYFRNVKNPGPTEYRHYIQYACYPGYTLAHGDVYSCCQQGRWSGITPVCLELTPCSVNNGGCSQLCSHSQHYNQSFNQTQSRTECRCRPGFSLLDDGRTCRDVDECVEQQHQCQQRCVNTFGSFQCSCDDGYQQAPDQISCTDQDECADNQGLGPCMKRCHNTPGSYLCSCTHGQALAVNGHSCIPECPPGYRKQPTVTPENTTASDLREECVDINECQEEGRCGWQCVNLPGTYKCICPRGYTLQGDGPRCKDINECSRRNGGCSHVCVNQKGGYKCACPASHRLSPNSWKKCLPRTTASKSGP
ncbi:uncharacterized protein LOC117810450 [Notolabrus celidotus]|uniref:uncharacterized protein LOC117810450 n=1 Tax=Notolabrus celidotus TaxID=1203425 RepID=UPI00148F4EE7|nr:uncharacterized protein LOC117810450 [Notolabrus celidotus]